MKSYKPLLKWAGGKRSINDLIEKRILTLETESATFFDLFVGSAAVAFNLEKHFKKVVINDTNEEIVNVYEVVKFQPQKLIRLLQELKENHSSDQFYNIRAWDRETDYKINYSKLKRAARTIYLNKTCYNGLYRVNLKGQFNVPIGRYENPNINDFENINNVSSALKTKYQIFNSDFSHLRKFIKSGDVVYLDPPYDKENKTSFIEYTSKRFDVYDQERLADFFEDLTNMGVYVILSNSTTDKIKKLYKKYINGLSYIKAPRSIGASKKSRIQIDELLIDNFEEVNRIYASKTKRSEG